MRTLWLKLKNSAYLPVNELLGMKVLLVLVFMFLFGALTIPVSILEAFSVTVTLVVALGFFVMFATSFSMVLLKRVRLAMHLSIYTFIGLTVYYVSGATLAYGYFFFFITLIVIIFFQDVYAYTVYGGSLIVYGILYINAQGEALMGDFEMSVMMSNVIHQIILVGFFLFFLVYFILSDTHYEQLATDFATRRKAIDKYRMLAMKFSAELDERDGVAAPVEDVGFQKAVSETALFINELFEDEGENIIEVVEFYFALHQYTLDDVLADSRIAAITKRYASELDKFRIDKNTDLMALFYEARNHVKERHGGEDRYVFRLEDVFTAKANQLMVLGLVYVYLRTEWMQLDKWGRVERSMTHEEICELFKLNELRTYLSYEHAVFFLENEDLFNQCLR